MLVLTRAPGESLRINENIQVTIAVATEQFVDLAITDNMQTKPRLLTLGVKQRGNVTPDVSVVFVHFSRNKVRLGFDGPRETRYERPEFDG